MSTQPALLFYCQHSLGMGHLARAWALAEALCDEFTVVLASGGARPRGLRPPRDVEVIDLPALSQDESGRLWVVGDSRSVDQVRATRSALLLDIYRRVRPSVVVVELFPFGRRKFGRELMPLLDATLSTPRPIVVSSVRDLLVDRGTEQQRHDDRAAAILDAYFDAVLVHTDPRFSTLAETFRPSALPTTRIHHTGFVVSRIVDRPDPAAGDRRARHAGDDRTRPILVSGGGGRFARPLYETSIAAHRQLGPTAPPMIVVAGPLCPDETIQQLRSASAGDDRIRIVETVPDLGGEMRASCISVSQCGYNTALDILQARVPALVVPFADNGDSEQTHRATRLAQLNALRMLPPSELQPDALATAIHDTLNFVPDPIGMDLDGGRRSTRLLADMCRNVRQSGPVAARQCDESLA